jgi:hypothetical protein
MELPRPELNIMEKDPTQVIYDQDYGGTQSIKVVDNKTQENVQSRPMT